MTSCTLDCLHCQISWLRGLCSELLRFVGDRSDLFALMHGPTWNYVKKIREQLIAKYPDNAGLPAPIDVQVIGHDAGNYQIAEELRGRIAQIPGAVDVNIHQIIDGPSLLVDIDRTRAEELGLTE